jgi:2-polyprenyl-3-methyl-5-hydroxy-6-metoxy-1,4-benzoquinol methylase
LADPTKALAAASGRIRDAPYRLGCLARGAGELLACRTEFCAEYRTSEMRCHSALWGVSMPEGGYFEFVRTDIAPLLPSQVKRVLDVGCGAGVTGAWVKARYPGAFVLGLEGESALREAIERNVDQALIHDLAEEIPDIGTFDLVLLLDVLEHLQHPERVLRRVHEMLAPGGTLIVSLPNVAHLSVSIPLLLFGRFQYADAGILDRTHLRFFVHSTAAALLRDCGFAIVGETLSGLEGPRARWLDRVTLGALRYRLAKQLLFRAERRS